jgi:hypothetical protein
MKVYYDKTRIYDTPRMFPYGAAAVGQAGYVDFVAHPELIESTLEDFAGISHLPVARTFFDFLRWINGPESVLQTCDCALRIPEPNKENVSQRRFCTHGRVFILYRDLRYNSSPQHSDWLCSTTMRILDGLDESFDDGVIGFTKTTCLQEALSKGTWTDKGFESDANDPGLGHHCMLSFWAFGDSPEEALVSLERLFKNIWSATEKVSGTIKEAHAAEQR